jgi:hypothetical protein
VYDTVTEQVAENYSVCVPVTTMQEVSVQVCKQVPTTVQVPVYSAPAAVSYESAPMSYESAPMSYESAPVMQTGAGCTNCNQ